MKKIISILIAMSLVLILVLFLVGCNVPKTGMGGKTGTPTTVATTTPTPTPTPAPTASPSGGPITPNVPDVTVISAAPPPLSMQGEAVAAAPVIFPPPILPPECEGEDNDCICYFPLNGRDPILFNPASNQVCNPIIPIPDPCIGPVEYCNDGNIRRPCDPPCDQRVQPPPPRLCLQMYCGPNCRQDPTTCECVCSPPQPPPPRCLYADNPLWTGQVFVPPNPYDNCNYPVPPQPLPGDGCGGRYILIRPCIDGQEVPEKRGCEIVCVPKRSGSRPECEGKLQHCSDGSRAFLDPVTCQSRCPPGPVQPQPPYCPRPTNQKGICIYPDGRRIENLAWDPKRCNWVPCPPLPPRGCFPMMAPCGDGSLGVRDPNNGCRPVCPDPRADECPIYFVRNQDNYDQLINEMLSNGCIRPLFR